MRRKIRAKASTTEKPEAASLHVGVWAGSAG